MRLVIGPWVLMALALPAQGQQTDMLVAQQEHEVTIEAGKIEEPCIAMALADRLEWEFSSDTPLDFNLHYHQEDAIFFPVNKKNLDQDQDVFIATGSRQYCMMWTNRDEMPSGLRYRYQLYRSKTAQ